VTEMRRTCIVTGAAQGIGRDIARTFARDGDAIVIADINGRGAGSVAGEITAEGGAAIGVASDISSPGDVAAVMKATLDGFGGIDILVNNAAQISVTDPLEVAPEEWDSVINSMLRGTFLMSQAAARWMIAANRPGVIVHIASVQAHRPWAQCWPYAAAKGGLVSMARAMAQYLAKYRIRVCVVSPGAIGRQVPDERFPTPVTTLIGHDIPLQRLGTSWDVARAVRFLCSADADYITGTELVVDGGLLVRGPDV
jgi:NAD(P)-dependent dehydrogenase (short-subunit alcohol dehydrogenase family)